MCNGRGAAHRALRPGDGGAGHHGLWQYRAATALSARYCQRRSVVDLGVTDKYIGSHYFKKLMQLELTYGDTLHHLGDVSKRMQETAGVFS